MTKQDYLTALHQELNKNAVADAEDVVSEYEQHFQFKLADGFTEEEIAAKLGAPAQMSFRGAGADMVFAYIVKPVDFDPAKKYPVAFLIHGGPDRKSTRLNSSH